MSVFRQCPVMTIAVAWPYERACNESGKYKKMITASSYVYVCDSHLREMVSK